MKVTRQSNAEIRSSHVEEEKEESQTRTSTQVSFLARLSRQQVSYLQQELNTGKTRRGKKHGKRHGKKHSRRNRRN